MAINNISKSDQLYNFFRAVEAARKRGEINVDADAFTAQSSTARKTQSSKTVAAFQPSGSKIGYGSVLAISAPQTQQSPTPKRILGNFFDAYA